MKQSKQPEVIRLHSIDGTYRSQLFQTFMLAWEGLNEIKWIPSKIARGYGSFFKLFNDAIFNYLTIVKTEKTLGEEYTYLNMFNEEDYEFQGVPVEHRRRVLLFILTTFGPSIMRRLFKKIYTEVISDCKADNKGSLLRIIASRFPDYDDASQKISKIVLMLFLIKSDYFNLYERLLKVKYIYLRHFKQTTITYTREGYIMLMQIVFELLVEIYNVWVITKSAKQTGLKSKTEEPRIQNEGEDGEEQRCQICSENITNKSATPCGHVFCWDCIIKWTEMKPECPSCRTQALPSRIIQLRNF